MSSLTNSVDLQDIGLTDSSWQDRFDTGRSLIWPLNEIVLLALVRSGCSIKDIAALCKAPVEQVAERVAEVAE